MLTLTRMKCLIYPTIFSSISSSTKLTKKTSTATLFSVAATLARKPTHQNATLTKPTSKASAFSVQNRNIQTNASSSSSSSSGEIHVIVGPMFAGKTTSLLRRVQAEQLNGRKVAVIKSDKDTRYGLDSVVTHDGMKLACWALENLSSFRQNLGHDAYDQLDVIGIDEAQFFGDLYDFCRQAADHDGKTVIIAGLDGDYLRRSFGSVLDIVPLADSVTKLTARCELCGKRAFFTLRKTDETETELIGGAEVYMPVCREHYVSGQVVIETAKSVLKSQRVQCNSCI